MDLITDLILEMTAIKTVIGYQGADNRPNRLLSFELFHTDVAKLFSLPQCRIPIAELSLSVPRKYR